jgi:hypothetical protein
MIVAHAPAGVETFETILNNHRSWNIRRIYSDAGVLTNIGFRKTPCIFISIESENVVVIVCKTADVVVLSFFISASNLAVLLNRILTMLML